MKSILIYFIEVNKSIFKEVLFILLHKNIIIAYHKIAYLFTNKIEKYRQNMEEVTSKQVCGCWYFGRQLVD